MKYDQYNLKRTEHVQTILSSGGGTIRLIARLKPSQRHKTKLDRSLEKCQIKTSSHALRKDLVILQLYWWLFSSTNNCC